jgi:hypothetical protein
MPFGKLAPARVRPRMPGPAPKPQDRRRRGHRGPRRGGGLRVGALASSASERRRRRHDRRTGAALHRRVDRARLVECRRPRRRPPRRLRLRDGERAAARRWPRRARLGARLRRWAAGAARDVGDRALPHPADQLGDVRVVLRAAGARPAAGGRERRGPQARGRVAAAHVRRYAAGSRSSVGARGRLAEVDVRCTACLRRPPPPGQRPRGNQRRSS